MDPLNPENILVNMFALRNLDPDISTGVVHYHNQRVHVSSGARVEDITTSRIGIDFRLRYVQFETSYTIVAGLKSCPEYLQVAGGETIPTVDDLDKLENTQSGWLYRPTDDLMFIRYYHPTGLADLQVVMTSSPSSDLSQSPIKMDDKSEEE